MSIFESEGIGIRSIACAVPDNAFERKDFLGVFPEEIVDKFSKNTGIKRICKALPDQTAGDLAFVAAQSILEDLGQAKDDIGILLFVTQSPDYRRPATACVLHERLELPLSCASMDINLGCSGFVYGMQTMVSMMASSDVKYGLLLLGETASKLANPLDKTIAMMYGDAGAAILFERNPASEIICQLYTDGSRFRSIILPAGGFRDMYPEHESFLCEDGIERTLYDIHMDGTAVFSFSISDVPEAIRKFLDDTNTTVDDYDLFLFHQANRFIIKQLAKKLKIPLDKIPISLDRFGNTGGVSIPLTLCDAASNFGQKELRVLTCGFGIGLSWGVASFTVEASQAQEITYTSDFFHEGKIEVGSY